MSVILDSYLRSSRYSRGAGSDQLVLETATGLTPQGLFANPVFFSGTINRPDVAAASLLALVELASTRYFNPIPGGFASLDPVVTANGDRLRCEVFSACNGVYARLDLLAQTFDHASLGFGTTNVDINAALARALAGIGAQDSLHLTVGPDQVDVTTPQGRFEERKVDLPERWVRALAETQSLAAALEVRQRLDGHGWRRFVNALPMTGGSGAGVNMWLLPTETGLRQTSRPQSGAIALPGSARLTAIRRVQHLIEAVHIYGPSVGSGTKAAVSAWEFMLPGARLTLLLSPEPYRGFSGEGALLHSLSQAHAGDALTIGALLAWEAAIDQGALARESGLSGERVHHALQLLATSGHVGFDLNGQTYFHRQLPYVAARVEANYPRLVAARALEQSGAVATDGARLRVRSEEHLHWVSFADGVPCCTCYFWSKYKGSRGPCKHILAAQLFLDNAS